MDGAKITLVPHTPPVVWPEGQMTVADIMVESDKIKLLQQGREYLLAKDTIDELMRHILYEISRGGHNPQALATAGRIAYDAFNKRNRL